MLFIFFLSCASELDDKTAATITNDSPEKKVETKAIEKSQNGTTIQLNPSSKIEWVGSKVSGDHRGGFQKISGSAIISGEGSNLQLAELEASFDMNSLFSDSEKLTKHLLTPDFFDAESFPTSNFTFSSYENGVMTGTLTLRGVQKEIAFPCVVTIENKKLTIQADFTINRKDFGIIYPGRPDDLIRDEVLLKLDITYN